MNDYSDLSELAGSGGEARAGPNMQPATSWRTLARAVEQSPASVVITDTAGRIEYVNPKFEEVTGYSAQEVLGQNPRLLKSGHTPPETYTRLWQTITAGGQWRGEFLNRRKDGSLFWERAVICAIRDEEGRITQFLGVKEDITETKRLEEALRRSQAMFRAIGECAQDAVVMMDPEGRVSFWNPAAERIFGYSAQEALGQNVHRLLAPERFLAQHEQAFPHFQRTGQGAAVGRTIELVGVRKGGEEFPIELSLSAVHLEGGWHAVGLARDISDRKRAEQERAALQLQIAQAQKLESIGRLAAGIAHEINTPTQFIGDNLRFLQEAWTDLACVLEAYGRLAEAVRAGTEAAAALAEVDTAVEAAELDYLRAEMPKAIEQALEGVARVTKIVRAMKEFSHPGSKTKEPTDLNHAIESTVTVARNEWKYVADLKLELDPSLPQVPLLVGEFNQVMLNLLVNAAHAIAEKLGPNPSDHKGTITISTRRDGQWVEVRVADTGCGIPERVRDKLFTPFFTTKPLGKGTGQGLALARAVVVEQHGGTISFESEEDVGTCFILRLPLTTRSAGASHSQP